MASIVSTGMSKFGNDSRKLMDHLLEASAGIVEQFRDTIDYVVLSTPYTLAFNGASGISSAFTSISGLVDVPYMSVENTSASGSSAILAARSMIESGQADHVLVVGGEKMNSYPTRTVSRIIATLLAKEEASAGLTLPSVAAFTAKEYINKYDCPRESIANVAVQNHHNGSLNPLAHFQKEIPMEKVMESRVIADPLRLFEFCPISDGAAALFVVKDDLAESFTKNPINVLSAESSSDTSYLSMRSSFIDIPSIRSASAKAFRKAALKPEDIDVVELHDMASILEIVELEEMGIFPRGHAWEMIDSGYTALNGELPVNTGGGLISRGHPLGATGVAQAVEIAEQLSCKAQARQVKNHDVGLSLNMAGYGNNANVIIYGVS